MCVSVSCSVVSDSSWPYGLEPARLFCPWGFPGKNIGVGCHFLLQGIFPIQGSNPGEGEWDPWYCHHFHIYSSCCFEHNSQRFNINSRGWIPVAEPGLCSELRGEKHSHHHCRHPPARWTNYYGLTNTSSFSNKSFTFFLKNQPSSMLIHSFDRYFFMH